MRKIIYFKIKTVFLISLVGIYSSCSDYLNIDGYFDDEFNIDSVFANVRYMEAYMWGAASIFPDEATTVRANYTPGIFATDEGFCNFRVSNNWYYGLDFSAGFINAQYYGIGSPNLNQWGNYYKIIRKCTSILVNIDKPRDMTTNDRFRIEGYTRFMRAYAYYNILVDFGPPILLGDELIETNENMDYYDRARSTYDEAVEYICTELEAAGKLMPTTQSTLHFGRPTQGAAYALVARLRLIHASPAFNGGFAARSYFGNWTRKTDGAYYVSQEYDEKRWAIAAAAAKRVIDMKEAGEPLYQLHTWKKDSNTKPLPESGVALDPDFLKDYPDGAGGIDNYKSYSYMFNGETFGVINSEYIWAKNSDYLNTAINIGAFPTSMGGWSRFCLTQKVVDAYLMDDGRTREEATADNYYSEIGFTTAPKNFSDYTLNAGVYNMYANREMRFYACVGFNEAVWKLKSLSAASDQNKTAAYYYGGADGKGAASDEMNYPITGYVIRKYVNDADAFKGIGNSRIAKTYPILRLAEMLLSYAEALNNLTGSYTIEIDGENQTFTRNTEEIKQAFNKVRYRAGLPGLTALQLSSADEVQKQIERERMIEFLWENRRYYDVRRWGIYEDTERVAITGMNMEGSTKATFYQRVIPSTAQIRGRVVDKKLLFVPIPRAEMRRLPSLDQNPGW